MQSPRNTCRVKRLIELKTETASFMETKHHTAPQFQLLIIRKRKTHQQQPRHLEKISC